MIHKFLRVLGFVVHYTAQFLMFYFLIYFISGLAEAPCFLIMILSFTYSIIFLQEKYVRGTNFLKHYKHTIEWIELKKNQTYQDFLKEKKQKKFNKDKREILFKNTQMHRNAVQHR